MRLLVPVFVLALLPLFADVDSQKKFQGTWEAKFKDKVICTMRVRTGEAISGETQSCNISVDANGDLQESENAAPADTITPMLNPTVDGDTLKFEDKDDDDVLKFEFKIVGDGQAELTILNSPVSMKPIRFVRK